MRPLTALAQDRDVTVAEDDAADDVPTLRLDQQSIACPLARLGPLQLGREIRDRHDELVDRAVEPDLLSSILVFEDAEARQADLLQDVVGLELLAPETVLIGQEQRGE